MVVIATETLLRMSLCTLFPLNRIFAEMDVNFFLVKMELLSWIVAQVVNDTATLSPLRSFTLHHFTYQKTRRKTLNWEKTDEVVL